ncbi:MAG TPA: hypothetical protein VH083_19750 [Myxococcales bacterium]|nr:hypothetical protein [Myxococcales bacterium]
MLRLLLRLLLFALPIAALFAALEWKLRSVPTSFSVQQAVLRERAATAEVLVVGSSHEHYGFYPPALGCPAVNLANVSQSLELSARIAERVELPKLRQAVFGLSYFSFGYRLRQSSEKWRMGFYEHYFGVREETGAVRLPQLSDFSVAALYDAGTAWYVLHHQEPEGAVGDGGWQEAKSRANLDDDAAAARRVAGHEASIDDAFRPGNVAVAHRAIQLLEARGVRVTFVFLPVHESYRRRFDPETLRKNGKDLARALEGTRARVLDYQADPRFGPGDFVDFDHLGPGGARKLTRILSADLGCP